MDFWGIQKESNPGAHFFLDIGGRHFIVVLRGKKLIEQRVGGFQVNSNPSAQFLLDTGERHTVVEMRGKHKLRKGILDRFQSQCSISS